MIDNLTFLPIFHADAQNSWGPRHYNPSTITAAITMVYEKKDGKRFPSYWTSWE